MKVLNPPKGAPPDLRLMIISKRKEKDNGGDSEGTTR
jgi:hypothetical protein